MLTLYLRPGVRVHQGAREDAVDRMDARALLSVLTPERARFVGLARARLATAADAEDVVQRAMMRAADRVSLLEDPARARAWFHRILRNAIADQHRTGAMDPSRAPSSADLDDLADERTDEPIRTPCTCAMRLLEELRPSYVEVLRRVDVAGEEPNVVAASLGISPGNLHVRLHRARRALQERVCAHCGVDSLRPCLDCTCDATHRCAHG